MSGVSGVALKHIKSARLDGTHDRSRSEQRGQGATDSTTDAVQSKDVQRFVDPQDKLESGGQVGSDGGDGADTIKVERGQSTRYRRRHRRQAPTHATAEATPTYPAAGVIPTNPAIAPEQNPTAENLRSSLQSINIHTNPPVEADIWVTTRAMTARKLLDNPEPPLKPNQPSQRNAVPRTTKNVLCGL